MAHKEYGIFLVSLSWFTCLLFAVVLYRDWEPRWKHLISKNTWNESNCGDLYWVHRSKFIIGSFLVVCFFELSIGRTLAIRQFLWDINTFPGWATGQTILIISTATAVLSLNLARAWRLKISHKYYAQIANSEWARLMDADHSTQTFWIKHRNWLNSNLVVGLLIVLYIVLVSVFMVIILISDTLKGQWVAVTLIIGSVLLPLSLVWTVPDNSTYYKLEVKLTLAIVTLYVIIFAATLETIEKVYLWRSIILSFYQCTLYSVFIVIFVYIPWLNDLKKRNIPHLGPNDNISKLARRMFAILSDESQLSAFMRFSCEKMCAENMLAVLEIREFKSLCRGELTSEPNSPRWTMNPGRSFIRIPSVLTPTVSAVDRPPTPVSFDTGDVTFEQLAGSITDLSNPHWSSWDQHCLASLNAFGARSSIVSDKNASVREKAKSLCEKYFVSEADFLLNVSHFNREQVLNAVYDSSLDDHKLLFVFDAAVSDIFDNLYDTLLQFESENE